MESGLFVQEQLQRGVLFVTQHPSFTVKKGKEKLREACFKLLKGGGTATDPRTHKAAAAIHHALRVTVSSLQLALLVPKETVKAQGQRRGDKAARS